MRKTIVYIGGFILPDKNAAAHRVLNNGLILKELGYNVVYLGKDKEIHSGNIKKINSQEINFEFNAESYPNSTLDWIKHLSSVKNVVSIVESEKNVEAIIAYNYPSLSLLRLKRYCKKKNIKIYSDCTEWSINKPAVSLKDYVKNIDTNFRMRFVHSKLNGLIAISRYLEEFYRPRMSNVIYMPPLVDKKSVKWNISNKDLIEERNVIRIIYAGSPGNGLKDRLDLIINSIQKVNREKSVRQIQFTVVGLTEEQYLESFEISDYETDLNIVFKGRLPHLDTLSLIKRSDFSLFVREDNIVNKAGFPTKFVESFTCGTPVITNLSSNIRDYISEGENAFIINSIKDSSLEKLLSEILELNKGEITKMKDSCAKVNDFDYNNYINEFNNFLK